LPAAAGLFRMPQRRRPGDRRSDSACAGQGTCYRVPCQAFRITGRFATHPTTPSSDRLVGRTGASLEVHSPTALTGHAALSGAQGPQEFRLWRRQLFPPPSMRWRSWPASGPSRFGVGSHLADGKVFHPPLAEPRPCGLSLGDEQVNRQSALPFVPLAVGPASPPIWPGCYAARGQGSWPGRKSDGSSGGTPGVEPFAVLLLLAGGPLSPTGRAHMPLFAETRLDGLVEGPAADDVKRGRYWRRSVAGNDEPASGFWPRRQARAAAAAQPLEVDTALGLASCRPADTRLWVRRNDTRTIASAVSLRKPRFHPLLGFVAAAGRIACTSCCACCHASIAGPSAY
jgi:hypothetical protein